MSDLRTHRYCNGKGEVPRVSGAPGHCFGCHGTGTITVYTAAEKAAKRAEAKRFDEARDLVREHAKTMTPPKGVSRLVVSYEVAAAIETLSGREPERMSRLYASLDAGHLDDVVYALYAYRNGSK